MKVPYINLKEQNTLLKKEISSALSKIFQSANFILGPQVNRLEETFARYCGTRYAVGVNSGTDALFLALKILKIGAGDEVITSPNSFLATATSIVAAGAKPVFVDVREDMNIDPSKIEEKISSRTRAIMPVHLAGKPADMDSILKIAKKHGLDVIEDAAQAVGALYRGKKAGAFGTINCFSMHPLKTLNAAGDGGMITTDDEQHYRFCLQLRNIGLKNRTESDHWGYNSRLDSIQASIIQIKFKYLDQWIRQRRKNADFYRKRLSGVVECPSEESFEKHAYHLFVIQADKRNQLQDALLESGIETKIHYPIPIHLQKCARDLGYKKGDFPQVEKQSKRILSLPIYQTLTQRQLAYVVEKICKFYR